ncbi:MAG: M20/M25/M40 family metallo-hydrolase [Burkholderiales bacterium]|nr:M20/M25/M40 family metallo-hydrolase [Burkholderiales bacterium]MCE7875967.1 M20/M25/M40 family metallo-hydrolase [Betaproteobacteria bacterium PRO3]
MTARSDSEPTAVRGALHAALVAHVDAHHGRQIAFLRDIVRVPSDTPPGDNAPAAAKAAELLEALGHEVERHPVPPSFLNDYGMASVVNLIVRHRFGAGGPTIALNAHGDVVPPGEGWTKPPYEGVVEDGRMYARGVAVSKSDIASYTFALEALRAAQRNGAKLRGAVELHFTYDEEFGGLAGPGWLLSHGLTKPDYAIAASFSYAIVTAHNGCLQLEVTVHGRAAHGSMPKTGVDALRAAAAILDGLYAEADRLETVKSSVPGIDSPTLVVGRIEGGINTNVVPDRVVLKLDRRMIPEERPDAVEAALRARIESIALAHPGVRVDIRRLLLARALEPRPGHEKLVGALRVHAERIFGVPIPAVGVPLYADARLYGEHGVPIVMYGAGPRTILEANAKRADEHLVLEDLRRATAVVACALADLLSA